MQNIEEILRREERFSLALQGANDGIWDWNLETNEAYFSPRWKQMLGYSESELSDHFDEWHKRLHPEDFDRVMLSIDAYLLKKTPAYEHIHRMQHKNGHYIWILARGIATWNAEGQAMRFIGTHVDITSQKHTEEALRQAIAATEQAKSATEQANLELMQVKTTLDMAMDAVFMIEAETLKIVYANNGAVNLFGTSRQELLQMNLMDFEKKHQTSFKSTHRLTELLLDNTKNTLTFEGLHQRPDGSWMPVEIFAQYIAIPGQGHRFIEIVRDISERKQAEQELQRAKNAAEAANRAKSTFLANMSHELRTPLNGILGYTQILQRDSKLTDKQRDGINIIQRSGEYLLTLINDVLDLSKIEAGRIELYPADFNFSEFVTGLTELFQMRAQQKGIAFIYESLSRLPTGLHGDEKRLRQILINLLSNAIKFTDRGGVSLKIGYVKTGKLRFQVEDTGQGIAQADFSKIFLPFHQVGDLNYRAEGSGLGLTITQKLVELMGGQLHVQSQLGQGSTFWLELDLPEVTNIIKLNHTPRPIIRGYEGRPRQILVVDDKWENRSVMTHLLKPLGFEVAEAAEGRQALALATTWKPDLIITDLVMPLLDGFELARQLRKIPEFQDLPIIACSASVFDYHQQQSLEAGCNGFLPKPVRAEELLEILKNLLQLTWIYEQTTSADTLPKEVNPPTANTASPVQLTSAQATLLFQLAEVGDIKGILKAVEEIEKQDEHLKPLTNQITQLANDFEDEQICEMLKPFLMDTDNG